MQSESFGSVKVFWRPYSRERLVELLQEQMPALAKALPLKRVILFGSWAANRATAFSDVDVMVIYEDPPLSDAYERAVRAMHVQGLEAHVYSRSQAQALAPTLENMTREGIVIHEEKGTKHARPPS